MIHARYQVGFSKEQAVIADMIPQNPCLHISLTTLEEIKKFQEILNRSLNCAPEFGKDWFDLSDHLDTFIRSEESKL